MIQHELPRTADEADVAHIPASTRDATWRYLGDRTAADGAYCARFGVTVAPEPYVAPGGVWAYALPNVVGAA